jgi:hypothetical protein
MLCSLVDGAQSKYTEIQGPSAVGAEIFVPIVNGQKSSQKMSNSKPFSGDEETEPNFAVVQRSIRWLNDIQSSALHLLQRTRHLGHQCRAFVDEAGVDLHHVGSGFYF